MPVRVHVNCAITLDGCLGGRGRTPLRISNSEDLRRVHALRAACDAILVGIGTVLADDPKLTVKKEWTGPAAGNPLRVILDADLQTPAAALVRNADAPTVFFARTGARNPNGMDVEAVPIREGRLDLSAVLDRLAARGVKRLLVEGGARVLTSFFQEDRIDEATVFVAPRILGQPDAPRLVEGAYDLRSHLRLGRVAPLGDGLLLSWVRI